jgi:peptidoglycan hydrolase CwlO-like protein
MKRTLLYIIGVMAILVFFSARAVTLVLAVTADEERKTLEVQLADLESQIAGHEATIGKLKLQGKTLNSEISRLNATIGQIELKIKAANLRMSELDKEIVKTRGDIQVTEEKIFLNKDALARAVQAVYEASDKQLFEVLLTTKNLTGFFGDMENLLAFQGKVSSIIDTTTVLKKELEEQHETLNLKRTDAAALKAYQASQKAGVEGTKKEKNNLLAVTKGSEKKFQEILVATKKTAAEIRSRVFQLLGGGELSFDQAYKLAKLAEGATGVRAALILAVLDRESALGQNVGKCKYNQVNPKTGKQAMHPTRDEPIFLAIAKKLNIDPNSITVSCANADGAYGGAMGPAQFIPSTWKMYEAKIGSVTGANPVNPWNNAHAVVATGLYLKDAGALVDEKKAAAKYYCGGNWNKLWVCMNVYAAKVKLQADQFQEDIDILENKA